MLIDLEEASPGEPFRASVCVLGGGIAGLVMATRLARQGVDVHLLEAGGLTLEERSQSLYRTQMAAENHRGANEGRFRVYGGSSTQWGGQILPFTHDIFQPPPGLNALAWPIREEEIAPFYNEVQQILGVNSLPFTEELLGRLGHGGEKGTGNREQGTATRQHRLQSTPLSSDEVMVRFAKWAPFERRNLARTLGAEAMESDRITVFTHANAVEIRCAAEAPDRVSSVRVVNYAGKEFVFAAKHFVLCAGTVESSRLLLCSPSVPNPHDQIGRYFHDHVAYPAAELRSPGRERALEMFGPFYVNGTTHSAKLEASVALREREGLLPVMAHIVIAEPEDSGAAAVRALLQALQRGELRKAISVNLLPVLRGAGDIVRLLYFSKFRGRRAVSSRAVLTLNIDLEQAPDRESRVMLSATESDALGMPQAVVQWRAGERSKDTAARYAPIMQRYLAAAGITSLEWSDSVRNGTAPPLLETYHMMGGLRTGVDPAESAVDVNLRFHQLENLHVASCAVFPTGGSSNPTFTMMALTLRLARRLGELMAEPR